MVVDKLFGSTDSSSTNSSTKKYPILADESVMSPKAHGTSEKPVQAKLRWNCDYQIADRIWYVRPSEYIIPTGNISLTHRLTFCRFLLLWNEIVQ
jgi:hypothetical protein